MGDLGDINNKIRRLTYVRNRSKYGEGTETALEFYNKNHKEINDILAWLGKYTMKNGWDNPMLDLLKEKTWELVPLEELEDA